uniref:ATP synthase subunit b n=1 Tax=Pasteuria ramosa TaxID=225322 RepID=Q1KT17_9BACL|nr:AtpF [Pasteuria ramosa]
MLEFELGTMIYQLIAFLILVFLIGRFALKPLLEIMEKRKQTIATDIHEAKDKHEQADKYLQQQKEVLLSARKEAKEIIAAACIKKEAEAATILLEARKTSDQLLSAAKAEIEKEKQLAIKQVRDKIGLLAVQPASRVLEKELDRKQHERLIVRYLKQVRS